jgi:hypothetical protein
MRLFRNQAGDTIVEVLIAITVVAAVLGGSYTVVNRTMANSRQAQEHAEALQMANKQVEYITSLVATAQAGDLYDGNPRFSCINKDTGVIVGQTLLGGGADGPAANGNYALACRDASPAGYLTAFEYVSAGRYFKVYITWPSVTGDGNDRVSLVYRPYRP